MNKSVVLLFLVCGVFAGTARQASAQGATWADRGYINIGWGVESGSSTMTDSRTAVIYDESATVTSTSTFTSGSLFDVGVGLRIWRNLTAGVSYHQEQNDTDGKLTGPIPSPIFFNRPREHPEVPELNIGAHAIPVAGVVGVFLRADDPGHVRPMRTRWRRRLLEREQLLDNIPIDRPLLGGIFS